MTKRITHTGPGGITLVIDHSNADTPAMVLSPDRRHSATYDCACGEGELDFGAYLLTREQSEWLDGFADAVATAYDVARA